MSRCLKDEWEAITMEKNQMESIRQRIRRSIGKTRYWGVIGALALASICLVLLTGAKGFTRADKEYTGRFIRVGICEGAIDEACKNAYNACLLECPQQVYDYDQIKWLYGTSINKQCKDVCKATLESCRL
jgi:hypothetical protein